MLGSQNPRRFGCILHLSTHQWWPTGGQGACRRWQVRYGFNHLTDGGPEMDRVALAGNRHTTFGLQKFGWNAISLGGRTEKKTQRLRGGGPRGATNTCCGGRVLGGCKEIQGLCIWKLCTKFNSIWNFPVNLKKQWKIDIFKKSSLFPCKQKGAGDIYKIPSRRVGQPPAVGYSCWVLWGPFFGRDQKAVVVRELILLISLVSPIEMMKYE